MHSREGVGVLQEALQAHGNAEECLGGQAKAVDAGALVADGLLVQGLEGAARFAGEHDGVVVAGDALVDLGNAELGVAPLAENAAGREAVQQQEQQRREAGGGPAGDQKYTVSSWAAIGWLMRISVKVSIGVAASSILFEKCSEILGLFLLLWVCLPSRCCSSRIESFCTAS